VHSAVTAPEWSQHLAGFAPCVHRHDDQRMVHWKNDWCDSLITAPNDDQRPTSSRAALTTERWTWNRQTDRQTDGQTYVRPMHGRRLLADRHACTNRCVNARTTDRHEQVLSAPRPPLPSAITTPVRRVIGERRRRLSLDRRWLDGRVSWVGACSCRRDRQTRRTGSDGLI